jgi:hypothetical protein
MHCSYINAPERALYNRLIVGAIQLYTGFLVVRGLLHVANLAMCTSIVWA